MEKKEKNMSHKTRSASSRDNSKVAKNDVDNAPVEKLVEKPVEKLIEKPTETPVAEDNLSSSKPTIKKPVEKQPEESVEKQPEESVEKQPEESVEKPMEKHAKKPVGKFIEQAVEKPSETPVEKDKSSSSKSTIKKPIEEDKPKSSKPTNEKPVEKQTEKSAEKLVEKPAEDDKPNSCKPTLEKQVEKSAKNSVEKPAETPVEKDKPDSSKPTNKKSVEESAAKPVEESAAKPVGESAAKPIEKSDTKPLEEDKLKSKPTNKPIEKRAETPVEDDQSNSSKFTIKKPVEEDQPKSSKPTNEKPIEKQTGKSSEKPVKKPVEKLVEKPVEKPVEAQVEKPVEEDKPISSKPTNKKSIEKPPADSVAKPVVDDKLNSSKPTNDKPVEKQTAKPVEEDKPNNSKPTIKKTVENPTEKPAAKSADKPIENEAETPIEEDKPSSSKAAIAQSLEKTDEESDERSADTPVEEDKPSSSKASTRKSTNQPPTQRLRSNKSNILYKYETHIREPHNLPIFSCAFNFWLGDDQPYIFATCGANQCNVYECPKDNGIKHLLCYADPDAEEIFYTCAWSYKRVENTPLIAVAGSRGIIRLIDIRKNDSIANFVGHGQSVNQVKFNPRQSNYLLSCGKDHGIRLWDIETLVCIAVFGGVEGHRDEVLSIDFDVHGQHIVSSGMDHALKIWSLSDVEVKKHIDMSKEFTKQDYHRFRTYIQHYPNYSTRDIHSNYVDCVFWMGKFVISKSCNNVIICWKPGQVNQSFDELNPNDSACTIITEYHYSKCDIWFVRFGFNPIHKLIAVGNQKGETYVWELNTQEPKAPPPSILTHSSCNSIVRQTAFSRDSLILINVCDDGSIWRWNRNPEYKSRFSDL